MPLFTPLPIPKLSTSHQNWLEWYTTPQLGEKKKDFDFEGNYSFNAGLAHTNNMVSVPSLHWPTTNPGQLLMGRNTVTEPFKLCENNIRDSVPPFLWKHFTPARMNIAHTWNRRLKRNHQMTYWWFLNAFVRHCVCAALHMVNVQLVTCTYLK